MENMFIEVLKISPALALFGFFCWQVMKNYNSLVESVRNESVQREERLQVESGKREERYQNTIDKNQEIIKELANKFNVVEEVKKDVQEIKVILNK
ncbi:BhlA/UviB family holin-like peptide [uncultured Clostridium sp.]|uniref:BhlA/UviB family holin-like peptide n=1 Tax=uncultured Clostridium sp. TaxID=59620 RepID=UPI0028F080FF|nr:BhlA/UviB family holin-like peptide [uncultured Clostridium sp.]